MSLNKICARPGCKKMAVDGDSYCESHQRSVSFKPKKKYHKHQFDQNGDYIYKTKKWVTLREYKLRLNPLCEHCEKRGVVEPAKMVDHIVEISDGGEIYDLSNLQSLCYSCHAIKTAQEARRRKKKAKSNGFGLLSDF